MSLGNWFSYHKFMKRYPFERRSLSFQIQDAISKHTILYIRLSFFKMLSFVLNKCCRIWHKNAVCQVSREGKSFDQICRLIQWSRLFNNFVGPFGKSISGHFDHFGQKWPIPKMINSAIYFYSKWFETVQSIFILSISIPNGLK